MCFFASSSRKGTCTCTPPTTNAGAGFIAAMTSAWARQQAASVLSQLSAW